MTSRLLFAALLPLISVVFWNLENFFDYFDNGLSTSDSEFSSRGARHWTKARFNSKISMTAKTLLWCSSNGGSIVTPPEIIGLAEVENSFVLYRLVHCDILDKFGYRYVHFDSPDPRGIDVALLYLSDSLELEKAYPISVGKGDFKTRDILYASLRRLDTGQLLHVFVNHHPSKYGGSESSGKRLSAMRALLHCVDSLHAAEQRPMIIAMGDFNDTPFSEAFSLVENRLINAGACLLNESGNREQVGSIRYHGNWQLIDNFLYSNNLRADMQILKPPFLMERDKTWPGEKPRRTYIGPRYNGGVSDHCPVILNF